MLIGSTDVACMWQMQQQLLRTNKGHFPKSFEHESGISECCCDLYLELNWYRNVVSTLKFIKIVSVWPLLGEVTTLSKLSNRNGSPPAGSRGRAPAWGRSPQKPETCWIFEWTKYIKIQQSKIYFEKFSSYDGGHALMSSLGYTTGWGVSWLIRSHVFPPPASSTTRYPGQRMPHPTTSVIHHCRQQHWGN